MPGKNGLQLDTRAFTARLRAFAKKSHAEANVMVHQTGEAILGAGQKRTPIETGTLQNSGTVEPAGDLRVVIGFNTTYAAAVHERTELHHEQGEAKYLENAIVQEGPRILQAQADEMKRRMGT